MDLHDFDALEYWDRLVPGVSLNPMLLYCFDCSEL